MSTIPLVQTLPLLPRTYPCWEYPGSKASSLFKLDKWLIFLSSKLASSVNCRLKRFDRIVLHIKGDPVGKILSLELYIQ